jgi:uncharacterized protein YbcI
LIRDAADPVFKQSSKWMAVLDKETSKGQALTELSNAMVALHREHFGRGPGAAKSFINDGMASCVLTDVYTQTEKALLEAGQVEHVRKSRHLHQQILEDDYKAAAEKVLGRRVDAVLSDVRTDPDVAVQIFLTGDPIAG